MRADPKTLYREAVRLHPEAAAVVRATLRELRPSVAESLKPAPGAEVKPWGSFWRAGRG